MTSKLCTRGLSLLAAPKHRRAENKHNAENRENGKRGKGREPYPAWFDTLGQYCSHRHKTRYSIDPKEGYRTLAKSSAVHRYCNAKYPRAEKHYWPAVATLGKNGEEDQRHR